MLSDIIYIAYKYLVHSIPLVDVSPLHRDQDSRHACLTSIDIYWIPSCAHLLHVLTSLLYRLTDMHALIVFVFLLHEIMDLFLWHRSWFIWLLHAYACILVTWLLPVTDMDIPVTGHASCWYVICGNPTSIVPVSRYIVHVILFMVNCSWFPLYCSTLSTELRSSYHVTRIMYSSCSCYIIYLI